MCFLKKSQVSMTKIFKTNVPSNQELLPRVMGCKEVGGPVHSGWKGTGSAMSEGHEGRGRPKDFSPLGISLWK